MFGKMIGVFKSQIFYLSFWILIFEFWIYFSMWYLISSRLCSLSMVLNASFNMVR